MRSFYTLPVMIALSACASTASTDSDQPIAKFRNAVYHVGDQPSPMPASTRPGEAGFAVGVKVRSKPAPQTDGRVF